MKWWIVGAAALALALGGGWYWWRYLRDEPEPPPKPYTGAAVVWIADDGARIHSTDAEHPLMQGDDLWTPGGPIKLYGLPGESIRIYGGDIFVRKLDDGKNPGTEGDGFSIASKPPFKLLAMMQAVHDTRYSPKALEEAGWPFRWSVWPPGQNAASAWKSEVFHERLHNTLAI